MNTFAQACRAAYRSKRPLTDGVGTWWALRGRPDAGGKRRPSPQSLDRILHWLTLTDLHHRPGWSAGRLRQRLLAVFLATDADARQRLRRRLIAALDAPADALFEHALWFASKTPLPEARNALVAAIADYAIPPVLTVHTDRPRVPDALIPLAVDALCCLGDPSETRIFEFVIKRAEHYDTLGPLDREIVRRAALATIALDPERAVTILPIPLRRDSRIRTAVRRSGLC